MKFNFKKALSVLMTLAIICSFAVVPASAAAGTAKLVLESDGWSGDTYVVDVYVESSDGSGVVGFAADIAFDSALMSCESIENIPGGYAVPLTPNPNAGDGAASVSAAGTTETPLVGGRLGLFRLTFKMAANAEKAEATVTVTSDDISADQGAAYTVTGGTITDTVPGLNPAVTKLTLSQNAVEVNGGSSTNVTFTAAKSDDTTVSSLSDSELKVSPADGGVTVSGGKVVVDGKAEAGTYIVSVNNGNPASTATATLTVTRAESVISSVKIDGKETIALSKGSGDYSAEVTDQYDEEAAGSITWTLGGDDAAAAKLSSTTGKSITVTLAEDAEVGDTFTLTAAAGGVSSKALTVKVVLGTVYATAKPYDGDYGDRVYIAIEDIDRANNWKELYLRDVLPQEVEVTYDSDDAANAKEYGRTFYVDWDYEKLWEKFTDLRKNWNSESDKDGRAFLDASIYAKASVKEGDPVEVSLKNWLEIVVDEGSADALETWGNWYEEESTYVPPAPSANFTDVAAGYWAAEDINWCFAKNVMLGNSATTFNPAGVTSRQQLWMVLARVNGSAPDSMATARTWAINMGVSDGTNVSGSLTRQQMVAMLYRYSAIKGYSGKVGGSLSAFSDAGSVSAYARDAMSWAVANGIITGNDGRLNPNGTATRAQFAAIMHRFCDTFKVI